MNAVNQMLEAALRYVTHGWPVFPLHTPTDGGGCTCENTDCIKKGGQGKHPRTRHGLLDATLDSDTVKQWWTGWPEAGIGIPTGPKSGLLVIDVDGEQGRQSLEHLTKNHGPLPKTLWQTTGRGQHLFLQYPNSGTVIRNSSGKLAPGLDVRGDGGYVVVPPSVHRSGRKYKWQNRGPVALAPDWLVGMVAEVRRAPSSNGSFGHIREGQRNSELTKLAGAMRRQGMTQAAIEAALLEENERRCIPPLPESEVCAIARSVARYAPQKYNDTEASLPSIAPQATWPDPEPLGDELLTVPPFDLEFLPVSFRALVDDIGDRMQTPPDYAGTATVVALAGCVGRRAVIRPKVEDTSWEVIPNLWGAIVAPPGMMKSPVLRVITLPLYHIEEGLRAEYESETSNFDVEKEQAELRWQAWREQYKSAAKKGETLPTQPDKTIAHPKQKRLALTDATVEKLHEILAENPAGVLVLRDELTGWLAEMERPGREAERAFFLQAWNGDSGFTIDRIGRGSIYVPAVCISLVGNIQPARLRWYLAQMAEGGPGDDGLFQRFQLLVWPDQPHDWKLVDRAPNNLALVQAERVYSILANLSADDPVRLRFAADAQQLFFAWLADLERKVRGPGLAPCLVSHLAKYRSLMPTLAGLFALADFAVTLERPSGELSIGLDHAQQAAAFCEYLEAHACRAYACIASPDSWAARELSRHIQAGDVPRTFTARLIYRKGWAGLDSPERVRGALAQLEDARWVRQLETESSLAGGRPSENWMINPKVTVPDAE